MEANKKELFNYLLDTRIHFLLNDWLYERFLDFLDTFNIQIEKIPITHSVIRSMGQYYLPWYPEGGYSGKYKNYIVSEYPKKIKVKKDEDFIIIALTDTKYNKTLIIDGCHRAVALYQTKKAIGELWILKSKRAHMLAIKDFYKLIE